MALLTDEEKKQLAKEGVWGITEKCDDCELPLAHGLCWMRKGSVLCKKCYDSGKVVSGHGKKVQNSNSKEEKVMATTNKKAASKNEEVSSTKVGGFLIANTALADLYEVLEDGKKHGFAELKKICAKHKKDLAGRLGNLRRVGEKKRAWALIVDKENSTVTMKLGTPPKSSSASAAPKASKKEKEVETSKAKSKASKKDEPEDDSNTNSKTLKAAATLIRRTLKSKKDWTRNKLTEHLVNEMDMDPKVVKEALNSEIKAGGITVEDGILSLV